MPLDFNNAPPQSGDTIPEQIVKVIGHIRAGGTTLPGEAPQDAGLFKPAKSAESDAVMLDWEFTVMAGPNAKAKLWNNMTVQGGKTDAEGTSIAGKISKGVLRAMIESARGIDPKDMSPQAMAMRQPPCYAVLNGIEFVAKIGIEAAHDGFKAKNAIDLIITPDKPEYARAMAGESIPVISKPATGAAKPAAAPDLWGQVAAKTAAAPAGAWAVTAPAAAQAAPAAPAAAAQPAGAWGTSTAAPAAAAAALPAWASPAK